MKPDGSAAPQPRPSAAADNIHAIVELERRAARGQTASERFSHRISQFAGSLTFVILHLCWFAGWAGWNALAPAGARFDPYPYGLLTFIVSMEGVLIATFVLITQNRMSRQSDERDHLNLQVDLLSEQEMTIVLRMLRRISEHIGVPPESTEAAKAERLTEDTNVFDLVQTLRQELPDRSK
jgi:uncharacterized membrane protein